MDIHIITIPEMFEIHLYWVLRDLNVPIDSDLDLRVSLEPYLEHQSCCYMELNLRDKSCPVGSWIPNNWLLHCVCRDSFSVLKII